MFDAKSLANLETLLTSAVTSGQTPPEIDVTVVIPTHGRPELLKRAIFSALGQTHFNIEVMVVIDGPDPSTIEAIRWIQDPRLSVISLESPVGGAEARNIGVRAAKGYYIALLDDDDEWLPDKLTMQLALADASKSDRFVVVSRYLYRRPGQPDEVWPGHLPSAKEPLSEFLFSSCGGFQTSTYLCPRTLFLANPFTPGLKKHQDWDWFLQLSVLPGFNVLVVQEPLSIYWVPLQSRSSVSGKLDWRFSASWAKGRLSSMTRKAYSTFLVKICLRSAFIQKEGMLALRLLFRELLLIGKPTPFTLGDLAAAMLIPEAVRARLRYGVMKLKRS